MVLRSLVSVGLQQWAKVSPTVWVVNCLDRAPDVLQDSEANGCRYMSGMGHPACYPASTMPSPSSFLRFVKFLPMPPTNVFVLIHTYGACDADGEAILMPADDAVLDTPSFALPPAFFVPPSRFPRHSQVIQPTVNDAVSLSVYRYMFRLAVARTLFREALRSAQPPDPILCDLPDSDFEWTTTPPRK